MLPVVAGERATRRQIFWYTLPMAAAAIAPWPLGYAGALYGVVAALLSAVFIALAVQVGFRTGMPDDLMQPEKRLFKFSLLYLFVLFAVIVADRWWQI
jgi:heme o synthase